MSESGSQEVPDDELTEDEITLTFESRDYRLGEFTGMIQGIQALLTFGVATADGLDIQLQHGGDPIIGQRSIPTWYRLHEEIATRDIYVEKVSLSSPLEITFIASTAAISANIVVMLRSWLALKDRFHRSQREAAVTEQMLSGTRLLQLRDELLGDLFAGRTSLKDVKKILDDPSVIRHLEQTTMALQHLQSVETRRRGRRAKR